MQLPPHSDVNFVIAFAEIFTVLLPLFFWLATELMLMLLLLALHSAYWRGSHRMFDDSFGFFIVGLPDISIQSPIGKSFFSLRSLLVEVAYSET